MTARELLDELNELTSKELDREIVTEYENSVVEMVVMLDVIYLRPPCLGE